MPNALPLLLIGGAALLMVGSKKKGDTRTSLPKPGELILPPTTPPPLTKTVKKSGSGYPGVTRARMQEIQTMLVANGYDVGPKGLDGRYGSATKQAVWEFQEDWGPSIGTPDGKPGPKTQGALEKAEADRVQGQREEAQKFPEEAAQLIDECDPLAAGTWGSGNVCEWNGSRWVRAVAKMSPTPKAKAAPAPEQDECVPANEQRILEERFPPLGATADSSGVAGWYCDYGSRIRLSDMVTNNMMLLVYPEGSGDHPERKLTYIGKSMKNSKGILKARDVTIGYSGDVYSRETGRLIAIINDAAIRHPLLLILASVSHSKSPKNFASASCKSGDVKIALDGNFVSNLDNLLAGC